ncbi:MAG: class I SAM-dependent methyltransferase [Candidatus Thermoplasmatota archaeon]|nr:class I SAM-dependent methyltransferase [Candidatus Thermoplasmatota archaeon]
MKKEYILESEKTWDSIAKSFDKTRRKPWQECLDFIEEIFEESVVADVACGNGRHLIPCTKKCKKVIGLDISRKMLEIVKEKTIKENISNDYLIHSTAEDIPLKDSSIDVVLYIAGLHNIYGKENRIKSLKEIRRILKKDSKAIISVWSRYTDKFRKSFQNKNLQNKKTEFGDKQIYWRKDGLNIPRFYHLYGKKEFVEDLKEAGFKIIKVKGVKIKSEIYNDNYFAVVNK